jgi:hypothetical protein
MTAISKTCSPGPCGLDDSRHCENHPTHEGAGYGKTDGEVELAVASRYFAAFLRPAWDKVSSKNLADGDLMR